MGTIALRPSDPFGFPDRDGLLGEVRLTWDRIREAGRLVDLLDQSVVRYDVWGDSYAGLQELLTHASDELGDGRRSPYPAEDLVAADACQYVQSCLRVAGRHVIRFDWDRTRGFLFAAGTALLRLANQLGVEL